MQEQRAASRGIRKKGMLINADDIPAAEEALHVTDSRRAGKTSSTAEWSSPMHTTALEGTAPPSHLLHPQAPCGASQG